MSKVTKKSIYIWIVSLFLLLFLALKISSTKPDLQKMSLRFLVFGTWVDITLYDQDFSRYPHLQQQLEDEFLKLHHDWHAWHPSQITRINTAFQKRITINIDSQMVHLLTIAKQLTKASRGYFEPAIGKLLKIWGFQRDDPFNVTTVPDAKIIKDLVDSHPTMNQITIINGQISSSNQDVQLDLGGFGKGFGLDLVKQTLLKKGITNFMLNGGGDIVTSGLANHRPWKIGIKDPFKNDLIAKLSIKNGESVFTSGTYERTFEVNGKSYHHILNPFTGYPARGFVSATVIGESGIWSDAAATTMLVAGINEDQEIASKMGVKHLLLMADDGTLFVDPGMLNSLEINPEMKSKIRIIELKK